MKIPEEAVEAAARAFYGTALDDVSDEDLAFAMDEARAALEAAAPHMLAAAWDRGMSFSAGLLNGEEFTRSFRKDNPYRSQA